MIGKPANQLFYFPLELFPAMLFLPVLSPYHPLIMSTDNGRLAVEFPEELLEKIPEEQRAALTEVLENDPRPGYQEDPNRIYGLSYGSKNIKFHVKERVLTVCEVTEHKKEQKSFDK